MAQVNMVIAQSTERASIWRRGLESFEELTEDECMQFFMFVGRFSNLWSVMHQLHEDQLLPTQQWLLVRNDIVSILSDKGGKHYWENGGAAAFDAGSTDFVNSELANSDQPYDMSKMTETGNNPHH